MHSLIMVLSELLNDVEYLPTFCLSCIRHPQMPNRVVLLSLLKLYLPLIRTRERIRLVDCNRLVCACLLSRDGLVRVDVVDHGGAITFANLSIGSDRVMEKVVGGLSIHDLGCDTLLPLDCGTKRWAFPRLVGDLPEDILVMTKFSNHLPNPATVNGLGRALEDGAVVHPGREGRVSWCLQLPPIDQINLQVDAERVGEIEEVIETREESRVPRRLHVTEGATIEEWSHVRTGLQSFRVRSQPDVDEVQAMSSGLSKQCLGNPRPPIDLRIHVAAHPTITEEKDHLPVTMEVLPHHVQECGPTESRFRQGRG